VLVALGDYASTIEVYLTILLVGLTLLVFAVAVVEVVVWLFYVEKLST
jgi:hypothetical protein